MVIPVYLFTVEINEEFCYLIVLIKKVSMGLTVGKNDPAQITFRWVLTGQDDWRVSEF